MIYDLRGTLMLLNAIFNPDTFGTKIIGYSRGRPIYGRANRYGERGIRTTLDPRLNHSRE